MYAIISAPKASSNFRKSFTFFKINLINLIFNKLVEIPSETFLKT